MTVSGKLELTIEIDCDGSIISVTFKSHLQKNLSWIDRGSEKMS